MYMYDDFETFSHSKTYVNNSVENPYLPFSMNYHMFNKLCDSVRTLTVSEQYDKYFLLLDLWSKMNSQMIFSRMNYEVHKE